MNVPGLSRYQKVRGAVWATGMAAIIIAGTWYGAGLKTQQEFEEEKKKILEAPLEEKIAVLEAQKVHLFAQKAMIEKKLDVFHQRVREREIKREAEAAERRGGG